MTDNYRLCFVSFLLLFSCSDVNHEANKNNKKNNTDTVVQKRQLHSNTDSSKINESSADYNGDGKRETAQLTVVKIGVIDSIPWEFKIQFSDKNIPALAFSCEGEDPYFFSEGKLSNDLSDEISIMQPALHGTTGLIYTYTLVNNKWKQIMNPVFYKRIFHPLEIKTDYNKLKKATEMIFKENGVVYYFEYDTTASGKMNKVKVVLK